MISCVPKRMGLSNLMPLAPKNHANVMITVEDVLLAVRRGEVVGFVQPNGAGKSTTMKMVSGFLEQDEGKLRSEARTCGATLS